MGVLDTAVLETLDTIFSAILIDTTKPSIKEQKEPIFRECINIFTNRFNYNIFTGEYALFCDIIKNLNYKMISRTQLGLIIDQNTDRILKSDLIDLTSWDNLTIGGNVNNEEKLELFKQMAMDKYDSLSARLVTTEEFNTSLNLFIDIYIDTQSLRTAQDMTRIEKEPIRIKTLDGKVRTYQGTEGRDSFYADQKKILDSLKQTQGIQSVIVDEDWYTNELDNEKEGSDEGLMGTGLPPIDDVTGELRRSNILGILGAPKGGKTKYANYLTGVALEKGLNVAVWVLEGTSSEWLAMQTSLYIRKKTGAQLNSNNILHKNYRKEAALRINALDKKNTEVEQEITQEAERIKQAVVGAKGAISTGQGRGKLSFIEGTAYIENFIDVIIGHYKNDNAFDVLVIDSLVNIQSLTGRQKVDRIGEAFMATKDLVAHRLPVPAIGILTAQLKQSTIDKLRSNPDDDMDITAGGESAETIRTPDIIHGLFNSKEQRKEGKTSIQCVGSRHSEAFDTFVSKAEFGCAYFEYDESLDDELTRIR